MADRPTQIEDAYGQTWETWTVELAARVVDAAKVPVAAAGYRLGVYGSTLTAGVGRDLDMIAVPIRSNPNIDAAVAGVQRAMQKVTGSIIARGGSLRGYDPEPGRTSVHLVATKEGERRYIDLAIYAVSDVRTLDDIADELSGIAHHLQERGEARYAQDIANQCVRLQKLTAAKTESKGGERD